MSSPWPAPPDDTLGDLSSLSRGDLEAWLRVAMANHRSSQQVIRSMVSGDVACGLAFELGRLQERVRVLEKRLAAAVEREYPHPRVYLPKA